MARYDVQVQYAWRIHIDLDLPWEIATTCWCLFDEAKRRIVCEITGHRHRSEIHEKGLFFPRIYTFEASRLIFRNLPSYSPINCGCRLSQIFEPLPISPCTFVARWYWRSSSPMLSGWAFFRDILPFCNKDIAKEVGGRIFEVGVFSRDYGICITLYMCLAEVHNISNHYVLAYLWMKALWNNGVVFSSVSDDLSWRCSVQRWLLMGTMKLLVVVHIA